jgi:hypothetical protein
MLGWATAVILDGGPSKGLTASTIVDCTGERPRLLREGAIGREELAGVLSGLGTFLEEDELDQPDQPDEAGEGEDPGSA